MQQVPFTPLAHQPWLRFLDRSQIPSTIIGIAVLLLFLPFYEWRAMVPNLSMGGGAFPPALAVALTVLLQLSRGATNDLRLLVIGEKIEIAQLEALAASRRTALIELGVGLVLGFERVYSQTQYASLGIGDLLDPGVIVVSASILAYTVVQVHLLTFCVRQVIVFRQVAQQFKVDLLTPELNNTLSNPLIRFVVVGLVVTSFTLLLLEAVPYASLQRRLLEGAFFVGIVWFGLLVLSLIPLFVLRRRIAVAKTLEIARVRRALRGDRSGLEQSQFGEGLVEFSLADLMYYEDRVKAIWEWPFEAHVRRLVLFGLLPPLTWIAAAGIEIMFETMLVGG